MPNLFSAIRRLLRSERGSEIAEYAIIMGFIGLAAVAVIAALGVKVLARWNSVNSSI
ncbi:MAG TPA: hypothetical protein VGB55_09335 [Tepidisphaeraceae bacterium]|jgi:Flp pilus assembly pilin Flp